MKKNINKGRLSLFTGSYRAIQTKQVTTQALTVGFEWEIPYNTEGEYEDFKEDILYDEYWPDIPCGNTLSNDHLYDNGYGCHHECGGYEVQSPVSTTLGTALAQGRWLIAQAKQVGHLAEYNTEDYTSCGIHVHIGLPAGGDKYGVTETARLFLNRYCMEDLLWEFSGRGVCGYEYDGQARGNGWDRYRGRARSDYRYEASGRQDMVKDNCVGTIEYRMFDAQPHILLPAIEFSHAVTKLCMGFTPNKPPTKKDFKKFLKKKTTLKYPHLHARLKEIGHA